MERKFKIARRWQPTDKEYHDTKRALLTEKITQVCIYLLMDICNKATLSIADESKICRYRCNMMLFFLFCFLWVIML